MGITANFLWSGFYVPSKINADELNITKGPAISYLRGLVLVNKHEQMIATVLRAAVKDGIIWI